MQAQDDTPSAVIDDLGGTGAVASLLKIGAPAVSNWRKSGIPADRWPELVSAGPDKVTYERLAKLRRSEAA